MVERRGGSGVPTRKEPTNTHQEMISVSFCCFFSCDSIKSQEAQILGTCSAPVGAVLPSTLLAHEEQEEEEDIDLSWNLFGLYGTKSFLILRVISSLKSSYLVIGN